MAIDNVFGTDKISNGYLRTYCQLVGELGTDADVCEIGVESGGGLRMFQTLFYRGRIVGVDFDSTAIWPDGCERVVADQADPNIPVNLGTFDLIVDDASHVGAKTQATFDNYWPIVRPGGCYVIEDWGVGFDTFAGFDSSMLNLARGMLDKFRHGDHDPLVESVTYKLGLIVIRKAG